MPATTATPESRSVPSSALSAIAAALAGLRFGQVTVIVHDGQVVQIDRTERQRLERANATGAADDLVNP